MMVNLLDIFRKDKKIKIEVIDVNNPITDHIKEKIGKFQVLFSKDRKFIWFKNAKVAGTSMYRGVMKREILDLISFKDNPKDFDKWWDDLNDKKLEQYFKFTFVRNPFDRLVSAFSHIIIESLINDYHRNMDLIEVGLKEHRIVDESGAFITNFDNIYLLFSLFVTRVAQDYDINRKSVHWMPQYILTHFEGNPIVDFIGKYENLNQDWKYVANKIKVRDRLPFISSSKTQKRTSKTRHQQQQVHWKGFYFSEDIILKVMNHYREDFDLLGYKPMALALKQRQKIRKDMLDGKR